jgi:hypothetical protein
MRDGTHGGALWTEQSILPGSGSGVGLPTAKPLIVRPLASVADAVAIS